MQKELSKIVIPVEGYRVPKLSVDSKLILPTPIISASNNVFRDTLKISITKSGYRFVRIDYKTWNSKDSLGYKTAEWKEYKNPFTIFNDTKIMAVAYGPEKNGSAISKPTVGTFNKIPNNWSININSKYNPQYSAGGDIGIIDGLRADKNWRKGNWQGYQSQDFECIIDLKEEKTFYEVGAGFLQDSRSWILFPTQVEYYVSNDGKEFTLLNKSKNEIPPSDENVTIQDLVFNWKSDIKYRYIKIIAKNFGSLPIWHIGHSMRGEAFIFVDEVWVK
jgi:hypothetical protein